MPRKAKADGAATAQSAVEQEAKLTQEEIDAAATNSPVFSKEEFSVNGKKFKIVHLDVDAYSQFIVLLRPLLEGFIKLESATSQEIGIPDLGVVTSSISVGDILESCLFNLPQLALIVATTTNPSITMEDLKKGTFLIDGEPQPADPFILAEIVIRQMSKNRMVDGFARFFARVLPKTKS